MDGWGWMDGDSGGRKPDGFLGGNFLGIHVQGVVFLIGISMEVRNYDGVRNHVYQL